MAQIDDIYKNRVAKLLRGFLVAKYAKEDNIPCKIEEGLFLGSVGVACNKELLKSLNVTHVLVVAQSLEPAHPSDFIYKKVEVLDSPDTNIEQYFSECFDYIDEAKRTGGGVLVHCFAGRSRSVTIILAYLMKKHHMSLAQALNFVKSKRPEISPNHGFISQLRHFERSLAVNQDVEAV
ncbi:dual specificity protein phosphatase 1-like [Aristolochia californica]|uniref:dual specificity protein phosphatase 1-like n=1 Tax=Aristolochia californica TaxID=171875 RepID=UPI0035D6825F